MFDDGKQRWTYKVARRCELCGRLVIVTDDAETELTHYDVVEAWIRVVDDSKDADDPKRWTVCEMEDDGAEVCHGRLETSGPPVFNYGYPLPDRLDTDAAAEALVDLPMVVVEDCDTGDKYLVLSGGGMDMSWEIAASFLALGYRPPAHLDLPAMAGYTLTKERRRILDACIQSHEIARRWMVSGTRRLRDLKRKLSAAGK